MKRVLAALVCLSQLSGISAFAAEKKEPVLPPLSLEDAFFGPGANPPLTAQEREALALARKWQSGNTTTLKPVQGPDGSVRFLFGAQQPSIVCGVFHVTDVELEPGEVVNSLHLGDQVRWTVEPALTGSGAAQIQHLVIKPHDAGLETSLMVTTNRRTYHLRLKSHRSQYMPRVAFIYPDAVMARWERQIERQKEEREAKTMPESGEYVGELDFDYRISGDGLKPLRVYNDGVRTIIQMPRDMRRKEAPTLLVLNGGEEVMVNYRLQGDRYIVDALFDKAMLIAGVGSRQRRVTITRGL